ncbi:glycosyltransferase [Patescibacteria group bacterium]
MLVSIIIPVRVTTPYLKETIAFLKKQSFTGFETIVVTDESEKISGVKVIASGEPGPAYKRNLGATKAKGRILAFLDDDSYPSKNWLKVAVGIFKDRGDSVTGVCGPCLTPPKDNLLQKASGWVWASRLGSGGAGTYRNRVCSQREVDDFPSVNLLVRKKDFLEVGGFDIKHWPGEDTKLCLDLVKKLKKKIVYDPGVIVYHHRREVFGPHLKQISRYARRRGFFAKKFPQTSNRIGFWLPTFFVGGVFCGGLISFFWRPLRLVYFFALVIYLGILSATGVKIFAVEKNAQIALLTMPAIVATHFWYGLLFPLGYFNKDLGVVPHRIDKKKKKYLGG